MAGSFEKDLAKLSECEEQLRLRTRRRVSWQRQLVTRLGEECNSTRLSGAKGAGVLVPTSLAFRRSRCRLAL